MTFCVAILIHQLHRAYHQSNIAAIEGGSHEWMVQEHYILDLESQVEDMMRGRLN